MPTTQSKEGVENTVAKTPGESKDYKTLIGLFGNLGFLTVLSGSMLFTARQAVARDMFHDAAEMTLFTTRINSLGALLEFFICPIFGKLADYFGRAPFLDSGFISMAVLRLIMFASSTKKWPLVVEQLISIPLMTMYFNTSRAACADKLEATEMAKANAEMGIKIGVSVILGPLLGTLVMKRLHPRYCYLFGVATSVLSVYMVRTHFKETLEKEDRKPIVLNDMQPFGFIQLLRKRALARLMYISGLQTLTEGRSINEIYTIYMLNDLKWTWTQINALVAGSGVALVFSGLIAKPMLDAMGMIRFTTFNNACNCLSLMSYAALPPFSWLSTYVHMYLGVLFAAPGGRKRDAAEALIMKIGQEEGFGNGFLSGAMMNFRSITSIIGPLLLGSAYAWGSKRGRPQVPFIVGCISILLAEASLRTLSKEDLGLDDAGQRIEKDRKQA